MIRVQLESHDTLEHVDDEMRATAEERDRFTRCAFVDAAKLTTDPAVVTTYL